MRYKIGKDIIIRSENASKPETQSSAYLNTLISRLGSVHSTFDLGCGKLRYQRVIARTTDLLALVDSDVQLSRTQMIRGRLTTIRDHVRKANDVGAYTVGQFASLERKFDRRLLHQCSFGDPVRTGQARDRPIDESKAETGRPLHVRRFISKFRFHADAEANQL
jgi:hypothetical protein